MKKYTNLIILALFVFSISGKSARAEIAVVLNPKNTVHLSEDEIKNIFLGKKKEFPNGTSAKPVDQADDRPIRDEFYLKIANKTEIEMKVYWSNLVFTGYGLPPKVKADDAEIKRFIQETPGGIGYINSKSLDASVQSAMILK